MRAIIKKLVKLGTIAFLCTFSACSAKNTPQELYAIWERLDVLVSPPARFDAAIATDTKGKRIFLFGGRDNKGCLNDLWTFNPADQKWEHINVALRPSSRTGSGLVYDNMQDRLILFGGLSYDAFGKIHLFNDLWVFTQDQGWNQEYVADGPMPRAWHAAAMIDELLIVFGGFSGKDAYYPNDIWALDTKEFRWKRLATDNGPRMAGRPCIVSKNGLSQLLIFGCNGLPKPQFVGIWALDVYDDQWSKLKIRGSPCLDFDLAVCDSENDQILVLKGPREDEVKKSPWRVWLMDTSRGFRDQEKLDLKILDWSSGKAKYGPVGRVGVSCTLEPGKKNSWICIGGALRANIYASTWRLSTKVRENE